MASYAFSAGKIRCLETRLLNKTDIERMVSAPDLETAFKVFNDTDYADNLADVKPHQFKQALDDDFQQARDLLIELIEDPNLRDFLFVKNDLRNIKLFFKAKLTSQDLTEHQRDFGTADMENLYKYIVDEEKGVSIPQELKEIVDQGFIDLQDKKNDPFYIDTYFDEVFFQTVKKAADKFNNSYINGLFSLLHRINTLKFFVRAKRLGKELNFVKDFLPDKYTAVYDRDLEEALRTLNWPVELEAAVEEFLNDQKLWKLEKHLEEAELEYIRKAKFVSYGPEVLVAYYFAKRNAIRNVRLIMTGKMNAVPADKIKERVLEIY